MKKIMLFILLLVFSSVSFAETSGQILGAGDAPYYISTVYDEYEIWDIQYAQADDAMYLVDGNDPPQVLTRTDHNDWTIEDVNFVTGPFLPVNTTSETITPSATTGSITLTYSGTTLFQSATGASHVGSLWQISQERPISVFQGAIDANESDANTAFFVGDYSFTTTGSWTGTVTLERSTDGGATWDDALTPLTDTNFDNPAETEEDGAIYRVTGSLWGTGTCNYTFTISDRYNPGIVRITAVTDGNTATATVLTTLASTDATIRWREGYWSDYRGWPKTVAFHQQRLIYGGSESYPQTIWFGKTDPDDYPNFTEGTLDTSAFTVALEGQNPIRWLKSQDYLLIGTSGSCGKYGEQGQAITPTSPAYQEQDKIGSASIMAIDASNSVLFIERGGRKVREFAYSLQYDKYLTPDLTIYAEDITETEIVDVAFQSSPDPTLWCVLNSGDIATLTYKRDHDVVGWTKQITDGDFESVCRIPGLTYEDEIWVVVQRTIDGSDVRYVEKFEPRDWGTDANDCWFVDSGLDYTGSDANEFNGLDHLIGENVYVYADAVIAPNEIVDANGAIVIDLLAGRVLVGLPFTSKLETLPLRIDPQDKAMSKKIQRVHFDFLKTGYCQYGNGANAELVNINWENDMNADPNAVAQALYTSVVDLKNCLWPWGSMTKQTIYVETDMPMPLTIRSITPEYKIYPK